MAIRAHPDPGRAQQTDLGVGGALAGLQWRLYATLNARMDRLEGRMEARMDRIEAHLTSIKERLSSIEGWIAGRFGEEPVPSA